MPWTVWKNVKTGYLTPNRPVGRSTGDYTFVMSGIGRPWPAIMQEVDDYLREHAETIADTAPHPRLDGLRYEVGKVLQELRA